MARGDPKWFASFLQKSKDGIAFDLNAGDTLKMGIVTNAQVPSVSTADPRWGAGGSTNFATSQVGVATGYAGPITLPSPVWTRSGAIDTLDWEDFVVPIDAAGGFADGYHGIFFVDTVAGKYAFGFYDLGGPVGNVANAINFNWNALGVLRITAS